MRPGDLSIYGCRMGDPLNEWRFQDERNVAVFTVRQVIERSLPILHVCRDAEDGGWQFLTGLAMDMNDAKLVTLESIVHIEPSVEQLADLAEGEEATRTAIGEPWKRRKR